MDFILDSEVPLPDDLAVIHNFSSPELCGPEKSPEILNLENLLNVVNDTLEISEKETLAVNEELNLPSTITPCIASLKENFFVELHNFESINNLNSNETVGDDTLSRNILSISSVENFQTECINFDANKASASDFGVIGVEESSTLQFENISPMKISLKRNSISEENIQCSGKMLINMYNEGEIKDLNHQQRIWFTDTSIPNIQNTLEKDLKASDIEKSQATNTVQLTEYELHRNIPRNESALSGTYCPSLQSLSKNITFVEQNKGNTLNLNVNKINWNDGYEKKLEKPVIELNEMDNDLDITRQRQDINDPKVSIDGMLSNSQCKEIHQINRNNSSATEALSVNLTNCKNYIKSTTFMNESNPILTTKPCKVTVKKMKPPKKKRSAFLHLTSQTNKNNYYNLNKDVNSSTEYKRIPVIRLSRIRRESMKGKKQNKLKGRTNKKTSKSSKHCLETDTSLYSRQKESLITYIHLYNSQNNESEGDVNMKQFKRMNFRTKSRNSKKRRKSDCKPNVEYHEMQRVVSNKVKAGKQKRKKVSEAENIVKKQPETNSIIKESEINVEQLSELSENKIQPHSPEQKRKWEDSYVTKAKSPKSLSKNIGKMSEKQIFKCNAYSFVSCDFMKDSEKNNQAMEFSDTSSKMLKEKEQLNNHANNSVYPEKIVKCSKLSDCEKKFSHGNTIHHANLASLKSDAQSEILLNESNPLSVIKPCRIMLKKIEYHIFNSNASLCQTSEANTLSTSDNNMKNKTSSQKKRNSLKVKSRKKLSTVREKKKKESNVITRLKEKSKKKYTRKKKRVIKSRKELLRKNEKVYIHCKKRGSLTFDNKRDLLNNQSEIPILKTTGIEKFDGESNDKQNSPKIAIEDKEISDVVDDMDVLNQKSEELPTFVDREVQQNKEFEKYQETKLPEQKKESNSEESYSKLSTEGTDKSSVSEKNNPKFDIDYVDFSDHSDNSDWYEVISDTDENEVSEEEKDIDLKENQVEKDLIEGKNDNVQISNVSKSGTFEWNDEINQRGEIASSVKMEHNNAEKSDLLKESSKNTDFIKINKGQVQNSELNHCSMTYNNDSFKSCDNGMEKQVLILDNISTEKLKESKVEIFSNPVENKTKKPSVEKSERKEIDENEAESIDSPVIGLPELSRKCENRSGNKYSSDKLNIKFNESLKNSSLNLSAAVDFKSCDVSKIHSDANKDAVSSIDSKDIPISKLIQNSQAKFKKNKFKKWSYNRRKKRTLSKSKSSNLHEPKFFSGPEESIFSIEMIDKCKHDSNSHENDINQRLKDEHVMEILGNRMKGLEIDEQAKCLDNPIEKKIDLSSSESLNSCESSKNKHRNLILNNLDASLLTKQCSVLLDRLDSEVIKIYTMNQNFLEHQKSLSYKSSYSSVGKFKNSETSSQSISPTGFVKQYVQKHNLDKKKLFKKQSSPSDQNTKDTRKCNLKERINLKEVKKSKLVGNYKTIVTAQQKRRQMKRERGKLQFIENEGGISQKIYDMKASDINIGKFVTKGSRTSAEKDYLNKLKLLFSLKRCRVLLQRCDSSSFSKNLDENISETHQRLSIDSNIFDSTDSEDNGSFNSKLNVSNSKFHTASFSKYCEISDSECSNLSGKLNASNDSTSFVDDSSYFRKTPYRMRLKSNGDNQPDDELNQVSNKKEFKNISCKLCDKSFLAYTSFVNHERKFHRNKSYKCILCNRSFKPRGNFLKHMRTNHPETEPFICDFTKCEESFPTENGLVNHQKCHANFFCTFCKKGFVQKIQMFQHISKWH